MSAARDEPRFLVDRMLGTLTRYLRFMGYDTESAHSIRPGNAREDTILLKRAEQEGRVLLTRDRELARRGGDRAILVTGAGVIDQVGQLAGRGVIEPELRMTRCSLCNEPLRAASAAQIRGSAYGWTGSL